MATISELMRRAVRTLHLSGTITFPNGDTAQVTKEMIVRFSLNEGAPAGQLLGCVPAADYLLSLDNTQGQWSEGGMIRGARALVGAKVALFLSVLNDENAYQSAPFGVFYVESVRLQEQNGTVSLQGKDIDLQTWNTVFTDTMAYPATLGALAASLLSKAGYTAVPDFPNASVQIKKPAWKKNTTLRRALECAAEAAGCFVRCQRSGDIAFTPVCGGAAFPVSPASYMTWTAGEDTFGPVRALMLYPFGAPDSASPISIASGSGAMLTVQDNPLFPYANLAQCNQLLEGMLGAVDGFTLQNAALSHQGDPTVTVGARISVTDLKGKTRTFPVTSQTFTYHGRFSCVSSCGYQKNTSVSRLPLSDGGVL